MRWAVAPIRIEKLPAPAPAAPSRPRVTISPHCDDTNGVSAMPAINSKPPNTSTRPGPRWSASAPNSGCTAPQTNWPMARAKLISAMPRPVLWPIGLISRPCDWRMPMVISSIAVAASGSGQ